MRPHPYAMPHGPGYGYQDPGGSNLFVPIPPLVRRAVLCFLGVYLLMIVSANVYNMATFNASFALLLFSNLFYFFWMIFPLIAYRPTFGYCHPLILNMSFALLNMIVRSTGMLMHGLPYHSILPEYGVDDLNLLYAYGNFVYSVALMSKYAGFFLAPKIRVPNLNGFFSLEPSRYFYVVLGGAIVAGLIAFYLFVQLSGGFAPHLVNMQKPTRIKEYVSDVEGIGHYFVFMRLVPVAVMVWLAAKPKAFKNPIFWIVTFTAMALTFLEGGRRSAPIYTAIVIGIIYIIRNRRMPYLVISIIGIAAFFFIGAAGILRVSTWHNQSDRLDLSVFTETSVSDVVEFSSEELTARSGTSSSYYAVLAKVPGDVPLLFGQSYVNWFGLFIPRVIWNNKPFGIGRLAGHVFFGLPAGVPPGPVGEAYWNFHIPGVIVVFFLFGIFLSWLGRFYVQYVNYPAAVVLYVTTLYYFTPFQTSFRNWILALIPATLIMMACGLIRILRR